MWKTREKIKQGLPIPENAKIEIQGNTLKYVSRGGLEIRKGNEPF